MLKFAFTLERICFLLKNVFSYPHFYLPLQEIKNCLEQEDHLGNVPNMGSNPGLPHCRRILYHLRYKFINRRVKYHELAETNRVMIIGKEKTFDKH